MDKRVESLLDIIFIAISLEEMYHRNINAFYTSLLVDGVPLP